MEDEDKIKHLKTVKKTEKIDIDCDFVERLVHETIKKKMEEKNIKDISAEELNEFINKAFGGKIAFKKNIINTYFDVPKKHGTLEPCEAPNLAI